MLTTLLWWLPQGGYSLPYLLGWGVCVFAVLFIIEMVAQNALLRVRSRMVSSLFLLLMAVCGFMHELCPGLLVQLSLIASLYSLLRTCEKTRPELDTFHSYLFLSLGSLAWPPLVCLSPVLLFVQVFLLRSLSLRSFSAAAMGLFLPYIFWSSVLFVMGDISPFVAHAREMAAPAIRLGMQVRHELLLAQTYDAPSWFAIERGRLASFWAGLLAGHLAEMAALVLVVLMGATGVIFYCTNSFDDKTRVRMCHYAIITMQLCVAIWLLLQPWLFRFLFPLLLFTSVPACAYWATFSHSWVARTLFVVLFLGLIVVGVLSLTPQSVCLLSIFPRI